MPVDFTKFRPHSGQLQSHPRDVFDSLSGRRSNFGYLRDVQGQVLDAWYDRRDERDVVIKMNTGTGKTAVGLLALHSSMNDGQKPALYITPNKFLTEQVVSQAKNFGIPYTEDVESSDYYSGNAIGITNIHKLVNGRSIFGGPGNYRVDPTPISSVAVDDAHACVNAIEEQTTTRIPHEHLIYGEILELFRSDLKKYSASRLAELEDRVHGVIFRIPIAAWASKISQVVEIIKPFREVDPIKFSWPFVQEILTSCQAIFSREYFEIQPLCPPTNMISSLEEADRRLYLTATLADDSIIITHFGASEKSAKNPITPSRAADIGDRLILSPLELNPNTDELDIRQAVVSLAKDYNVVILVPSYRRAKEWKDYASLIAGADDISEAVESLNSGHVGLVVFVNKYDGIDLPDDACRILVIDRLPEAVSNSERREAQLLAGSDMFNHRKLQRIEQGMGRGVRSSRDYCVVLLLGASLSKVLADTHVSDRLGSTTRAQLELSRYAANQIKGSGIDQMMQVINRCLNRDRDWIKASRDCLTGITYAPSSVEPFAYHVRRAFVESTTGQYEAACREMSDAINLVEDKKSKGWLKEQLATYMHIVNPSHAQTVLAGAIKDNPNVMRPVDGISYVRMPSEIDQVVSMRDRLRSLFGNTSAMVLGFRDLHDKLTFGSGNAYEFEKAFGELGYLLGFESQRPDHEMGMGPDVLWGLGDLKYLIIECKSEANSDIRKRDVGQLSQSLHWFEGKYDTTCEAIPLLVHHTGHCSSRAVPDPKMRILDNDNLQIFRESLLQLARSLAYGSTLENDEAVVKALRLHHLTASSLVTKYTRIAR